MKTFTNKLNEYEQGMGCLFSVSAEKENLDSVLEQLAKAGISRLIKDEYGKKKTVFFGDSGRIEALRVFLSLNLDGFGVDSNCILRLMLENEEKNNFKDPFNSDNQDASAAERHILRAG